MRGDHNLAGGETQAASHSAGAVAGTPTCEQAEGGSPDPSSKSPGVREWVVIAPIGLGLLLNGAWIVWLGYELVRFALWLFS